MRINWIAQILTITMNCNSFLCSKKCLENPPVECFEPNRGLFLRLRSGYLAVFATLRNGWWDGVFECQVCGGRYFRPSSDMKKRFHELRMIYEKKLPG